MEGARGGRRVVRVGRSNHEKRDWSIAKEKVKEGRYDLV